MSLKMNRWNSNSWWRRMNTLLFLSLYLSPLSFVAESTTSCANLLRDSQCRLHYIIVGDSFVSPISFMLFYVFIHNFRCFKSALVCFQRISIVDGNTANRMESDDGGPWQEKTESFTLFSIICLYYYHFVWLRCVIIIAICVYHCWFHHCWLDACVMRTQLYDVLHAVYTRATVMFI